MTNLKTARIKKDMKQTEVIAALAEKGIKITAADLSRYENGVSLPTKAQLAALREVLEIKSKPRKEQSYQTISIRLPESLASALISKLGGFDALKRCIVKALYDIVEK